MTGMSTPEEAVQLARDWLDAWNSHDLDRILAHYSETVEFVSPFVVPLLGDSSGTVRGKRALRDYFAKALARYPTLEFRLHKIFAGVRSVTVYYESVNDLMAAEVMELDDERTITRVLAHYAPR